MLGLLIHKKKKKKKEESSYVVDLTVTIHGCESAVSIYGVDVP